jgi:hypothetical protein
MYKKHINVLRRNSIITNIVTVHNCIVLIGGNNHLKLEKLRPLKLTSLLRSVEVTEFDTRGKHYNLY